jgi:hypothetical protein
VPPTPTSRIPPFAALAALAALGSALALGCAGAGVAHYTGDGNCLRPKGCSETGCCNSERACATTVCEGVGYVCGLDSSGSWAWQKDDQVLSCDDVDPCTEQDRCVSGQCLGVALTCTAPTTSRCIDGSTLRSFTTPGSCSAGTCSYAQQDTTCPKGCASAACTGQPCLGVQCNSPPSSCHVTPGTCSAGSCSYTQKPVGAACGTSDPCNSGGSCDAQGKCSGTPMTCNAPNASGSCVNGKCNYTCNTGYGDCSGGWADGCETKLDTTSNCGGCGTACKAIRATATCVASKCSYTCDAGWGNCVGGWADGCETPLNTAGNCGACNKSCSGGANAKPSCVSGACKLTCIAPFKDCDGKSSNGCEIPVAVANRCDKSGLNSGSGCGTAYCGSSSNTKAVNFGSWFCVSCSHCHHYSNGWSWCLSSPKQFSSDRCASCCNAGSADKVCPK